MRKELLVPRFFPNRRLETLKTFLYGRHDHLNKELSSSASVFKPGPFLLSDTLQTRGDYQFNGQQCKRLLKSSGNVNIASCNSYMVLLLILAFN